MGRKLDALLGRKFKTTKFKATVNLAISRITILKSQRQARLTVARSDIIQLLNLNHHEHALLRVDQVIKEQNMLDVYVMVDGYCHLLLQMVNLIEKERDCPDDLKEAVSSLMFAAPRCGEFPELQEIRFILTARYGKEFANGAHELRSNCGVTTRMIQKLSPRQSSLETRMKMLQEIATENDIVLNFEYLSSVTKEVTKSGLIKLSNLNFDCENLNYLWSQGDGETINEESEKKPSDLADFDEVLSFSESIKGKKIYKGVEDAAQAAFESAAYAAAAARAAVELSRSRSFGSVDSPNSQPRKVLSYSSSESKLQMDYEKTQEIESKAEHEDERLKHSSNSDTYAPLEKTMVFDESDNEIEIETTDILSSKQTEFDSRYEELRFEKGLNLQKLDITNLPIPGRTKTVF